MKVVRYIKNTFNSSLYIEGILLTMYEKGSYVANRTEHEAKMVFDNLVFNTVIPKNVKLGESAFYGKPALLSNAGSSGAQAYLKLAEEILKK
jgi:chromosome partitioning protein